MPDDDDLSLPALATLIAEFLTKIGPTPGHGRALRVDPHECSGRVMGSGPDGFVEAMSEFGLSPRVDAGLVVCHVTPVAGAVDERTRPHRRSELRQPRPRIHWSAPRGHDPRHR